VFYEMLTGRRPFGGDSQSEVLSAIIKDVPAPVADLRPGVPRELSRLVRTKTRGDVRKALLAGYPDRVAMRREPKSPRLLLSSGTGAVLAREANLFEGEFLVALDVTGGQEALVKIASVVEREWLTPTHEDVVHTVRDGKVRATKRVWYDSLLLKEIHVAPDPIEVERLTPKKALDPELARRLAFARLPAPDKRLDQLAPERLPLPSGRTVKLDYRDDGSVHASVKLQELFGLAETPRLGPDATPVIFELLAPNGRPVQITKDLRSFWNGGYQEVRKELRGRYPRHPWPDDPWTAEPTHRTKRR